MYKHRRNLLMKTNWQVTHCFNEVLTIKDSNTVPKKHPECGSLNFVVLKLDFSFSPSFYSYNIWKYLHIKLVLGTGDELFIKLLCEICGSFSFKKDFSCPASHCGEVGYCLRPLQWCFDDQILRISNRHKSSQTEKWSTRDLWCWYVQKYPFCSPAIAFWMNTS